MLLQGGSPSPCCPWAISQPCTNLAPLEITGRGSLALVKPASKRRRRPPPPPRRHVQLVKSGARDELKRLARQRLEESGWTDEVRQLCRGARQEAAALIPGILLAFHPQDPTARVFLPVLSGIIWSSWIPCTGCHTRRVCGAARRGGRAARGDSGGREGCGARQGARQPQGRAAAPHPRCARGLSARRAAEPQGCTAARRQGSSSWGGAVGRQAGRGGRRQAPTACSWSPPLLPVPAVSSQSAAA